jgi:hypothetical protein
MLLKFGLGTLGLLTLAKVYESTTDSYVFTRNLRTIRCGLHILYAYKIAFNENNYLDIHEGVAEDIYNSTSLITQPASKMTASTSNSAKA